MNKLSMTTTYYDFNFMQKKSSRVLFIFYYHWFWSFEIYV